VRPAGWSPQKLFGRAGRRETAVRSGKRLLDWLPLPDAYLFWAVAAARAARERLAERVWLMSTSPPESSHLAAWWAVRGTPAKWVADFRDPWVNGIYRRYPTVIHRDFQQMLESLVAERADLVLATSPEAVADLRSRYPGQAAEKFQFLPNGFDPAEFTGLGRAELRPPLRLIHAGNLTRSRSLAPLLEALARLGRGRIRLELAGQTPAGIEGEAERLGIAAELTLTGYLPRAETLKRIAASHLGLVVEAFRPGAELVIQGKIFDYLGAGLPVLALVPEGAAANLVASTRAGVAVTSPKPEMLQPVLEKMVSRLEDGRSPHDFPQKSVFAGYERPALIARLAGLLESL
ncbi:MAG: hypothetical protein V1794_08045, partial [Candidatus Glassbacteria bacterium]